MDSARRPRVVYISYDGIGEPLGRSQVLAYLQRLAAHCDIVLMSYEKDRVSREHTAALLASCGIVWRPLSYHKRPPLFSTVWDVLVGAFALRSIISRTDPDLVHVRSYVPALIALLVPRRRRWRLLFDIRGFWAEERVSAGQWRLDGRAYRIVKRFERWFFSEADAVVTLTHASIPDIRQLLGVRTVPVAVIPTCADLGRFQLSTPRREGPRVIWCGSLGSFYRFDLAVRFADTIALPFTVLTPQVEAAVTQLGGRRADVRSVMPTEVSLELRSGDIGLCLYHGGHDDLARAPTRLAEFLAAGMVVVSTPGLGDVDALVSEHRIGVVILDETEPGLQDAARQALALSADDGAPGRARKVAETRYSLEDGVSAYLALYGRLSAEPRH